MSDPDGDRKSLEPERRVAIRAVRACVIVAAFGALAASGASAAQNPFADLIGSGNSRRFAQEDEQISEKTGEARAYEIHYTKWQPATPNGKVIVYNHGFQSHRGWFYATANEFAGQGYAVYAFDRIGSGESSGGMAIDNGEVVDVRGHVRDWKLFLESVDLMLDVAVEENPGAELILWGNSYGAKVVTAYLYERGDRPAARDISAAVLTTPGNYRNKDGMPLPFSRVRLVSSGGLRKFPVPMVERNGDNGASWFVAPGPWFDRIREHDLARHFPFAHDQAGAGGTRQHDSQHRGFGLRRVEQRRRVGEHRAQRARGEHGSQLCHERVVALDLLTAVGRGLDVANLDLGNRQTIAVGQRLGVFSQRLAVEQGPVGRSQIANRGLAVVDANHRVPPRHPTAGERNRAMCIAAEVDLGQLQDVLGLVALGSQDQKRRGIDRSVGLQARLNFAPENMAKST
jgi:pimeloyl-ACP methyl ester carboxylesterase